MPETGGFLLLLHSSLFTAKSNRIKKTKDDKAVKDEMIPKT
ncbi:unnamed protein product [Musa acuminata subsp. malaccensis]|uniref:(wild Malaysian banana) hypothetical protein n=1 Tax=Musa acuminata subsp. malaccensis TaxID=214687 RepID=A0A804HPS3_MUSAM|nr:unnamed protein product [Musa acuminata subsp. malaccensis]